MSTVLARKQTSKVYLNKQKYKGLLVKDMYTIHIGSIRTYIKVKNMKIELWTF